jgi:hypothetical protein
LWRFLPYATKDQKHQLNNNQNRATPQRRPSFCCKEASGAREKSARHVGKRKANEGEVMTRKEYEETMANLVEAIGDYSTSMTTHAHEENWGMVGNKAERIAMLAERLQDLSCEWETA